LIISFSESTGLPNKIQVSQETADLLREHGKENQLEPRTDLVLAKGKGCLETFWLKLRQPRYSGNADTTNHSHSSDVSASATADAIEKKLKRQKLVDWNCSMLLPHLKAIVGRRQVSQPIITPPEELCEVELELSRRYVVKSQIREIIDLPEFVSGRPEVDPKSIELNKDVEEQLKRYVALVSDLYEDNPFHCFEHASRKSKDSIALVAQWRKV
jgi:hypothetical protein